MPHLLYIFLYTFYSVSHYDIAYRIEQQRYGHVNRDCVCSCDWIYDNNPRQQQRHQRYKNPQNSPQCVDVYHIDRHDKEINGTDKEYRRHQGNEYGERQLWEHD